MSTSKTPGQIAYEAFCQEHPHYPGSSAPRRPWHHLQEWAQQSWEQHAAEHGDTVQ